MEKNIFLIPTDKPSRLCIDNSCNELNYSEVEGLNSKHITNQNIYITNDEKVEIGEYGLGYAHGIKNGVGSGWFLFKHDGSNQAKLNALCADTKKVIITNDSELIDGGVQAIDDEFLQWFIKNPSCEVVKIEKEQVNNKPGSSYSTITYYKYKIINSQKEPMGKSFCENADLTITIEPQTSKEDDERWSLDNAKEFALNYFKKSDEVPSKGMFTYELLLRILEAGIECGYKFGTKASAKYSEEDMFEFSQWVSNEDWVYLPSKGYWVNEEQEELEQKLSSKEILDLWFEQYKKNTL
jgi:hypothetical protein